MTGRAELDNALSGIYDAMLLDVMLPKLDGLHRGCEKSGESGSTLRRC